MQEQECEGEPAHHARRPMNAFLIFCKRHRSVVRDKYPNLENRSITKILGEWWANLDKEEKSCYTGLAKQYKDAFFSANPDFKWYKLPAPPLRTLSSRPRETADKFIPQADSPTNDYQDTEPEKTNNNSTKVDFNKKTEYTLDIDKPLSMFTPGKLADVTQMGGLSSLLDIETEIPTVNPYYSPHTFKFKAIATPEDRSQYKSVTNEESIRDLQNALSETSKIFKEEFDEKGLIYRCGVTNDQLTNQDVIDQIVDKRYSRDDEFGYQRNWSDDEKNKSGRSCKGKRYQEFMAVGGLMVKKQKRDDKTPEDGYNASCSWESQPPDSAEDSSLTDDTKQISSTSETSAEIELKNDTIDESHEPENNSNKTFKAADFDLDAKIRALPSLSLEKFQQRKRENKRKKKSTSVKPRNTDVHAKRPSPVEERRELAESWRETVIGSQKRKPRKISITRLEINSMVSTADMQKIQKISPEIKIATEAPLCPVGHNHTAISHTAVSQPAVGQAVGHTNVDLLALATLAEVASNTSRIENTPLVENASKV